MSEGAARTALEKGHDLEREIEGFFAASGYETSRNVIVTGRSGGRHEIDVLAVKADGVTSYQVMVECKAWNQPVEKDVISKVAYVVQDAGFSKGIVVSLEGGRVGADQAARELGIDLWDGLEIAKRLGSVAVAELKGSGQLRQRRVLGPSVRVGDTEAEQKLDKKRSGLLGKESLEWAKLVWAPFFLTTIRVSHTKHGLLGRGRSNSQTVTHLYNGLSGSMFSYDPSIALAEVGAEIVIPAKLDDRKIRGSILKQCHRLKELRSEAAIKRQTETVKKLGIPLPFDTVTVEETSPVAWPYYIALLSRKGSERLIAFDAVRDQVSDRMSQIMTQHLSYISEAISR